MAVYTYKAKNQKGETITGNFETGDSSQVLSFIKNKGMVPVEITEIDKKSSGKNGNKIPLKDLSIFFKQFYTMLNAGVNLSSSLDMLRRQTENKKLAAVLNKVYENVQKGMSLSASMLASSDYFPVIVTSLIEVGEVSGALDQVVKRLSVDLEKESKIRQKIKSAMTYPVMIGSLALVMVGFMMIFVVPRFVNMFKSMGTKIPLPTQIMLNISSALTKPMNLIYIGITIFLVVYILKKLMENKKVKFFFDGLVLNLPIIGTNVRKLLAARFTRTMSSLLKSGVSLTQALDVINRVIDNSVMSKAIEQLSEDIRRGKSIAKALKNTDFFPVMVTHMINVGEEAGALDEMMEKIADYYDDELDAAITKMLSMLEPILIVVMAVLVGGIAISVVLPILDVYKGVKK